MLKNFPWVHPCNLKHRGHGTDALATRELSVDLVGMNAL